MKSTAPGLVSRDRSPATALSADARKRRRALGCGIPFPPALVLLLVPIGAIAQGGPPMITDDPDTPGDGHWEINIAATGTSTPGRRELAVPDADINYGWGEHVQLMVDVPWVLARDAGSGWKSGLGAPQVGVKWRLLDRADSGFSVATYPKYQSDWLPSSARRGISSGERLYQLPVEVATELGPISFDAEISRNVVQGAAGQWEVGAILAHACGPAVECMFEVRETLSPGNIRSFLNLGLHWTIDQSMVLLAAAGRDFAPQAGDAQQALLYLGIQLLR